MKQKERKMTQKEIVKMVLEILGGFGYLTDICVLAKFYIGDKTDAKDVRNNIRRELNSNPQLFCHVEGKPVGWWQLVSYKNEMSRLRSLAEEQAEELTRLRSQTTDVELLDHLIDIVVEMGENVINAHELSLNRLNRVMNHRYEQQITRLTDKSRERVEPKSVDIILGDKNEIHTANYNAEVKEQNNSFPMPTLAPSEQKQIGNE